MRSITDNLAGWSGDVSMDVLEREAWRVVERLEEAGYEAYLVGGCVRDRLLGREVYDYDITTSAWPQEVMRLFPEHVPTGLQHGTVTVLTAKGRFEVTTFRTDGEYRDGRRPEQVVFVRSLREDLARRDFTCNAMALGRDGRLHDPFGGREDLEQGLIRAVGQARQRFEEDALRMLRGIRFAAQLGFRVEDATLAAIRSEGQALRGIARERIREEWHKMLLANPGVAIGLLRETDTLKHVLSRPRTFDLRTEDPWGRGVDPWRLAGEWAGAVPRDLALRYAAVFVAVKMEEPRVEKCLQELKLPTVLKRAIRGALQVYALRPISEWSAPEWRQRLFQYGAEAVWRGGCLQTVVEEPGRLCEWERLVEEKKREQPIWGLQDLAVSGDDLIAAGVPEGPAIGRLQKRLAQWVLQEPECNRREELIRQAMEWYEEAKGEAR
jgi:tRNA nucleotidyltransferase (CCA-adding enzyme)